MNILHFQGDETEEMETIKNLKKLGVGKKRRRRKK